MTGDPSLCTAKLRDGNRCRSVATEGELCTHHARLALELGPDAAVNGGHSKRGKARRRVPVVAESEPFELSSRPDGMPSGVRPALALTAAEEVETIRRVLLEAATGTSRETWATCTCPECGKAFRQEISVPDHGARIKAVETLLREGLGRVGEAEVTEPKRPTSIAEVRALGWNELCLIFATSFAPAIRTVVDDGDAALRSELENLNPRRETPSRVSSPKSPELSTRSDLCLTRCCRARIHRELLATPDSASRRRTDRSDAPLPLGYSRLAGPDRRGRRTAR